nr:unnamed protein product [Spirometra erinaceieuropaei]
MISIGVVSSFTSIPQDLARDALRKCQQTFFTFNDRTYEQIKGTPMNSPIFRLVAELVLKELEEVAFNHYEPAFWRRYVDDTFFIIEMGRLADFQDLLNSIFQNMQFTKDDEHAEQLPFLDVPVARRPNGEFSTTVYSNEINMAQVLNYHQMAHKRGCVRALFQRVKTHCSEPEGRVRELRHLRDQLVRNKPKQLRQPLPPYSPTATKRRRATNTPAPPAVYKKTYEAMERIAAEPGVSIVHCPTATMCTEIMQMKERLDAGEQSGIVYQIPCRDCLRHYTGQTGRRLSLRITDKPSEEATHCLRSLLTPWRKATNPTSRARG